MRDASNAVERIPSARACSRPTWGRSLADGATAAARDSRCIRPTSTSAVEEGWESHGDDVSAMVELDGPPLLSAALKAPDDLVALLSAADGEDFVDRVHRLSARSEGIVELPMSSSARCAWRSATPARPIAR